MTRKKIALIAAGVLLAAGAAATVAAQGHRRFGHDHMGQGEFGPGHFGPGMGQKFGGWHGRGPLSKADFDTRVRERFAAIDKNSDNILDPAEIEAALGQRMGERMKRFGANPGEMGERMLRRFDGNKDGRVTKDEFLAEVRRNFAEMDLNNDGRITDDDLPPMMRGRGVLSGTGQGPMMGRGPRGMGPMAWLRDADANKDGVITLDEAVAAAEKRFATLDRSKDGVIEKADFEALRKEAVDYRVRRFVHHFGGDKDNRVTREQFVAKTSERFARMDWDNNGVIESGEMPGRQFGRRMRPDGDERPHRGRGPGFGPGQGPGQGAPKGEPERK